MSVQLHVFVPILFRRKQLQQEAKESTTAEVPCRKVVQEYIQENRGSDLLFLSEIPYKCGKAWWSLFILASKVGAVEEHVNRLAERGIGEKAKADGLGAVVVFPVQIQRLASVPLKAGLDLDEDYLLNVGQMEVLPIDDFHHSGAAAEKHIVEEECEPLENPLHNPRNGTAGTLEKYTSGFVQTIKARIAVDNVIEVVNAAAEFSFDYIMLIMVAGVLALFGLITDNVIVIVASMLVSPLMGPILAVTFGLAMYDKEMIKRGLFGELVGIFMALLIGFFGGLVAIPAVGHAFPTQEMWSRSDPRGLVVGIAIAIPSGIGVALSVLGNNTSSLVGVAISASLLPPAVNTGVFLAMLAMKDTDFVNTEQPSPIEGLADVSVESIKSGAGWSLLLTLSNILCIWVAGVVMFRIKEVSPGGQSSTFWKNIPEARKFNKVISRADSEALNLRKAFKTYVSDAELHFDVNMLSNGAHETFDALRSAHLRTKERFERFFPKNMKFREKETVVTPVPGLKSKNCTN